MGSQITQVQRTAYIDGLYVDPTNNLLPDANGERNMGGEILTSILGVYNALPSLNPVTITAAGLVITVGGNGQWLICQGRMCDNIPATNLNVPANSSGQPRLDYVCVQFNSTPTSGGPMQKVQQLDGSDLTQTIYYNTESVNWLYVEGTPGVGLPAIPSGYEVFAVIAMLNGATTPTSMITQFQSVQQLGRNRVAASGSVALTPGDGSASVNIAFPASTLPLALSCGVNSDDSAASQIPVLVAQTPLGFTAKVLGGPFGSTCILAWSLGSLSGTAMAPADGSDYVIVPFAPLSLRLTCSVNNIDGTSIQVPSFSSLTITGATVSVNGGALGTYCTLYWSALGVAGTPSGYQEGYVPVVYGDGTPFNIVFPTPYTTIVSAVNITCTVNSVDGSAIQVPVIGISPTLTGFTAKVLGGPPGSTCGISWSSNGT